MSASDQALQPHEAFALIVGISQYRDPRIPRLKFTHADAQAFHDLLVDPRRAGFKKENVKLLLDADATYLEIRRAVNQWMHRNVTADSTVLVFFAGHGGEELDKCDPESRRKAYYFLPWDTDPEDFATTGLSQTDFERLLRTLRSRRMVVFLDACHSTGVAKPGARDLAVVAAPEYEKLARGEGRVVIAAARPDQRSWEDERLRHGIFTYHLLEALRGKADTNEDGCVSIQEVVGYLQREVPKSVRLLGKEPQDPTMICESLTQDIILTVDSLKRQEWKAAQDDERQREAEAAHDRRVRLLALRNENKLPAKEFAEAVALHEKTEGELKPSERTIRGWLELLLEGKITPEFYLESRRRILSDTVFLKPEPPPLPPPSPPPPAMAHCHQCRGQNPKANVFCMHCGQRLR